MNKKYVMTNRTIKHEKVTLRQIRALIDFGHIKKGDLGGYIRSEQNLSQQGLSWIDKGAIVTGTASIENNAYIADEVVVSGNSTVKDYAYISDNAVIAGNSIIADSAEIGGKMVIINSTVSGQTSLHQSYTVKNENLKENTDDYVYQPAPSM